MNRVLRGMLHRRISVLLSVIVVVCLAGAGESSDDLKLHITTLRTSVADGVESQWKEQEVNILRCIPYLGSGLRTCDRGIESVQGVRNRRLGAEFLLALFAVLFKVTAICSCMLVWIRLYLRIDDCQTAIILYLHNQDGKKRMISC